MNLTMKYKLALIFSFLFTTALIAKSGDEVRNGGGLAENFLTHAFNNMNQSIELCLSQKECAEQNNGRSTLMLIKNSLAKELAQNPLKFSNDRLKPGYFNVDGYTRLAVTGDNIGDPIYYNLDLLYKNGEVKLNYGDAIQSLIHELGHHQKIHDHDQLELLGSEVRKYSAGTISTSAFLPHLNDQGFFAIALENKSFTNDGSLTLLFRNKMIDLSESFATLKNECVPDTTNIDPLQSSALQFFNLRWTPTTTSTVSSYKILTGNVLLYCKHKLVKQYRKLYEFQFQIGTVFTTTYEYKSHRLIDKPKYLFELSKNSH